MFAANPHDESKTLQRLVVGSFVVDREQLAGLAKMPPIVILSVYQVADDHIANYWQSVIAPPKPGTEPAPEPDPRAQSTVEGSVAAFNKGDVDALAATFGDSVKTYTLTSDTAAKVLGQEQLRAELAAAFANGAHPHISVARELSVGSFVASHERISGSSDGQPGDKLIITLVQNNHIVGRWEG
jgi:hypothetical protein